MDKTKVKVGSVVLNVIAILICIVLILVVASAIGSIGKDYVNFFGSATFAVKTNSMEWNEDYNSTHPEYKKTSFKKGAFLFSKVLKTQEERASLKEGDVIIFRTTEQGVPILVTHRIVGVDNMGANGVFYTTKGDNSLINDSLQVSAKDDVIAVYRGAHINGLGSVVLFVQTPVGFGLVVFLPSLLLLIYCAIMLFKNLKIYKTEKAVDDKEKIRQELMREMGINQTDKHTEAQDDTPNSVSHDE